MVANNIYLFCNLTNFQKGCISVAVHSMLLDDPILGGTSGLQVVH